VASTISSAEIPLAREGNYIGLVMVTTIDNMLMRSVVARDIASVADACAIVRESSAVEEYLPRDRAGWDEANGRFLKLATLKG
jgi:hypothetical protein